MPLMRKPFECHTLEEDKDDTYKIVSIRLNKKELEYLEDIKKMFNIKSYGKAIKLAGLVIGRNVMHNLFGAKLTRYLFKDGRLKLSDYEDIELPDNKYKINLERVDD